MLHKPLVISGSGVDTSITVDIALCPHSPKPSLFPLIWMASLTVGLVAYEYGVLQNESELRTIMDISQKSWDAFAQNFCSHVHTTGLQDIVSLKERRIRGSKQAHHFPCSILKNQSSSWPRIDRDRVE